MSNAQSNLLPSTYTPTGNTAQPFAPVPAPSNSTVAGLLMGPLANSTPNTAVKSVATDGQGSTTTTYYPVGSSSNTQAGLIENPAYNFYNPSSNAPGISPYISAGSTQSSPVQSGAPGSAINGGAITQNNATPGSQNGVQVGGTGYVAPGSQNTQTFTTPSGATVDANGNLISAPPQNAVTGLLNSQNANNQTGQTAEGITSAAGKQIAAVNTEAAGI